MAMKPACDGGKLRLLLLNGPNLNMLGQRDPAQYGVFSLAEAEAKARETAETRGYRLDAKQSNYEGQLIDWIQEALPAYAGIAINAGALTHYSYALADALELFPAYKVELHISDITRREPFRRLSVIRGACDGQIAGLGLESYAFAIEQLADLIEGKRLSSHEGRTDQDYRL